MLRWLWSKVFTEKMVNIIIPIAAIKISQTRIFFIMFHAFFIFAFFLSINAVALANLGVESTVFTVVPDNSLGKSVLRMLRSNNVNCAPVILSTPEQPPSHRLGVYFLETGFGVRSSQVVYDRKHSAFVEYDYSRLDVERLLDGHDWLHLSGITPALGKNCADLILICLKVAKEKGGDREL